MLLLLGALLGEFSHRLVADLVTESEQIVHVHLGQLRQLLEGGARFGELGAAKRLLVLLEEIGGLGEIAKDLFTRWAKLQRIAARDYNVSQSRIELGPIEKPWVAWKAARRSKQ